MNHDSQKAPSTIVYQALLLLLTLLSLVLKSDATPPASAMTARDRGVEYAVYFPTVVEQPEKVFIPAGTFLRGCDPEHNGGFGCPADELPLRTIFLDAFYIDRQLRTNNEYAACVEDGACTLPSKLSSKERDDYYGNPIYARYPVIFVNWLQAEAYCEWAGGSIPTEAQWEKAARGSSDTRAFPWGDATPTCELSNSLIGGSGCIDDTTAVGSYSPIANSPYGVQDLTGNVYEFMNDWYFGGYYHIAPDSNPQGPLTGTHKVRRSGAYGSSESFLRVATRIPVNLTGSQNYLGFRCAYAP